MRINLKKLFCMLALLPAWNAYGQQDSLYPGPCGFGRMNHQQGFDQGKAAYKTEETVPDNNDFLIIPVVFHIIHNGGAENIPDQAIYDQMVVLNEDYGRYGNGSNSSPVGGDTRIRFCLATVDPNGKPTSGIERIKSPYTDLQSDEEMKTKNLSRWDQRRYLNIWVVKSIDGGTTTSGYSYLAEQAAEKAIDGVVIVYKYIGRNEAFNPVNYKLGRTTTHEVGHYLNLLHTWGGDGPGEGGCGDDDKVYDTPDCSQPYFSKYLVLYDSCETPYQCGYYRLVEDYMDYSDDKCMNIFTLGQKDRMRQAILIYRHDLVSYPNALTTGCQSMYQQFNPPTQNILKIVPNPASGKVYIYPYFTSPQNGELWVYDVTGRLVMKTVLSDMRYQGFTLDFSGYRQGLYLFFLNAGGTVYKEKVILSR